MKNLKKFIIILLLAMGFMTITACNNDNNKPQEIVGYKEIAKSEIGSYKNIEDYRSSEQAILSNSISLAKTSIENASSIEEIEKIVKQTKEILDSLKTKEEYEEDERNELIATRQDAITSLNAYRNEDNYYAYEKTLLRNKISEAKNAIENASTKDEVQNLLTNAKIDIDKIKSKDDFCTLIFETNGGSLIESILVEKNTQPLAPVTPIKTNYIFVGWYSDSSYSSFYDFNKNLTQDRTIYAKWMTATLSSSIYRNDFNNDQTIARNDDTKTITFMQCLYDSELGKYAGKEDAPHAEGINTLVSGGKLVVQDTDTTYINATDIIFIHSFNQLGIYLEVTLETNSSKWTPVQFWDNSGREVFALRTSDTTGYLGYRLYGGGPKNTTLPFSNGDTLQVYVMFHFITKKISYIVSNKNNVLTGEESLAYNDSISFIRFLTATNSRSMNVDNLIITGQ